MNWNDPITYIALYFFVTIFIGMPTLRRMFRNEGCTDDATDAMLYYCLVGVLLAFSPIVVVVYWVFYQFIGKLILKTIIAKTLFARVISSIVPSESRQRFEKYWMKGK